MEKKEIIDNKKIATLLVKDNSVACGVSEYKVGQKHIGTIIDHSIEFDNGIDYIFHIYNDKGKLIRTIINYPVEIIYTKLA